MLKANAHLNKGEHEEAIAGACARARSSPLSLTMSPLSR